MSTERQTSFAARLRELRQEAGITQMELATKAGLHLSAVTRFEQGVRQPSLATAGQLAAALALPVDEFFKPCKQDLPPSSRGRPARAAEAKPIGRKKAGRPKKT